MRCFFNLTLTLMVLLIARAYSTLVEQRIALREVTEGGRTLTDVFKSFSGAVYRTLRCIGDSSDDGEKTDTPTSSPAPTASAKPSRPEKGFRMDRNGDGKISKKEYKGYLKRLGIQTTKGVDDFDPDGDGSISFEEMRSQTSGATGSGTFEGNPLNVDTDEDEKLSREELEVFWVNLGYDFTEVEKDALMLEYDGDSDGIISEAEFVTSLTSDHADKIMKMMFRGVKCEVASNEPSNEPSSAPL